MVDQITNFKSQSVRGDEIEFCAELDSTPIEITVSNLNFKDERIAARNYLFVSLLLLCGILPFKLWILVVALVVVILFQIYFFRNLIQFEKITVTKDFGVQLETAYNFGGKKSLFIKFAHIHNVVLSEVIQNLKVTFMPAFLTKGELYGKRPSIPIMNIINPRLDILVLVYDILLKIIKH